ncbi:MAG: hypothetical protein WCK92_15810 [Bacteroidota bacterium]
MEVIENKERKSKTCKFLHFTVNNTKINAKNIVRIGPLLLMINNKYSIKEQRMRKSTIIKNRRKGYPLKIGLKTLYINITKQTQKTIEDING